MGYAKRRTKHKDGKIDWGVFAGISFLIVVLVVVFCLRQNSVGNERMSDSAVDEEGVEFQGDNTLSMSQFKVGYYSNLQDQEFCKRHDVEMDAVREFYDSYRRANIYRYTISGRMERAERFGAKIAMERCLDECKNKIVREKSSAILVAEQKDGFSTIAECVVTFVERVSENSREENKIVNSTPNISYRGHDANNTKASLNRAITEVINNGCGMVEIQWKTAQCYIAWRFMWLKEKRSGPGSAMIIEVRSDQFVRDEDFKW